jgi:hypothetical protein
MVRSIRERERVGPAIKAVLIRRVFTSYGEEVKRENMEKEREKRGRVFANHRQSCCCCTSSLTVLGLRLFLSISIDKKNTNFDCHFDMTKVGLAIS